MGGFPRVSSQRIHSAKTPRRECASIESSHVDKLCRSPSPSPLRWADVRSDVGGGKSPAAAPAPVHSPWATMLDTVRRSPGPVLSKGADSPTQAGGAISEPPSGPPAAIASGYDFPRWKGFRAQ